ncbi:MULTISPECIES: peptidylprolyl isomerase [Nocardioides]|uniref:Peptidylprolyl isomerase n=1 Tax=Nocardioides kribbensis TaxID=305517 RepID=A0ABV1NUK3_9ACTN|nr:MULTISPECIES: peptidylprolyl isomerase [Nocardioides]KQP64925.1 peptidylprolyl isomerase [Nocardioides sp. Leaf285]KQQ43946.1 peptidylprolyl isomerase [Nocardioides sp. Leaf307]MCM3515216.1 peptidylprolyl isomerase [Nocardioides sp. P86]
MRTRPAPRVLARRAATRPLAAVAVVACLTSLAACGSDEEPTAEDTSAASPATSESASGSPSDDGSAAGSGSCDYPQDGQPAKEVDPPETTPTVSGEVSADVATSAGDIGLTLDADAAPCTVNSFVSLAEQGYFDGTTCHRLTTEGIYVLQCGDPTGTGTGGPGYTIPDELTGEETYPAGTLAMAKTMYPDSGGSQFFMVYEESPLPPDYTVFGTIDDAGLDLLTEIGDEGTDNGTGDGAPATPVDIESVTVG